GDDVRRGCAGHEPGTPRVPLGGLLVSMADPQERLLAERPAEDLHTERKAVPPEAVRKHRDGLTRDVPRGEQARLLPERDAAVVRKPWSLAHTGRDEGVELAIERLHLRLHPLVLAPSLHRVAAA